MAIPRVARGQPITADGQSSLIDQSNANADLGVDGMFWASGVTGHSGGVQPTSGIDERFFELSSIHAPGDTTAAYPIDINTGETDLEAATFNVVDVYSRFRGRERDEGPASETDSDGVRGKHGSKGRAVLRSGEWQIEWMQPHALRIRASANGPGNSCTPDGFGTSDTTICVDDVVVIQPIDVALLMADVEVINNTYLWRGENDAVVSAEWNDATEEWDAYAMDCANS